jgi:hypothetical protein
LEGRITADLAADYKEMAKKDIGLATKILSSMPAKASLSTLVNNPAVGGEDKVKTEEDFQKLSTAEQLTWKAANPAAYEKMFGE